MKKLILLFGVAVLLSLNATAQTKDTVESKNFDRSANLKPGTIISEKQLRKFAGIWIYNNAGTQLTLELKSTFSDTKKMIYSFEMLIGGYKLEKNGKTISNTLATSSIYAKADKNNNNKITLNVTDDKTFKDTPFVGILTDKNTLVISESTIKGEGIRKDPKLDFFKNLKFSRKTENGK